MVSLRSNWTIDWLLTATGKRIEVAEIRKVPGFDDNVVIEYREFDSVHAICLSAP